jgi:AraC-like DNA-binding protein
VVLVVGFGDPVQVLRSPRRPGGGSCASLVAGLHDSLAITGHRGYQAGIAVRLSPLRAYSLLGLPMHLVSNQLVDLSDVLGRDAARLADQLAGAAGWRQRFDLLGAALASRIATGPAPDRAVLWAWRQLRAAAGVLPIGELARQAGWSRRHLERRFLEQVGLPPKTVARIFRFERAAGLLATSGHDLAGVAAMAGYSDQAHFSRELRALAQCTPGELAAVRRPAAAG